MAGVMFNLLGEKDGTECFSRMSVAAHRPERDCGHCGTFTIHYNWTGETYFLTGDAPGRAMIDLQGNVTPPGSAFDDWADDYPALTVRTPSLDFDGGGLDTGIEWLVGGNPAIGSDDAGHSPTVDRTHPAGKLRFIFRRTTAAKNDTQTTIAAQYGSNLAGWTNAIHQGTGPTGITITEETNGSGAGIDRVTAALSANLAGSGKLFVRRNVATAEQYRHGIPQAVSLHGRLSFYFK